MRNHIMNRIGFTVLLLAAVPAAAQLDVPLPGLTAEELALFEEGKALYARPITPAEGLGPLFNRRACADCHFQGGIGGSEAGTANNVTHFGVENEFRFIDMFHIGGPVQQLRSLASEDDPVRGMCELQPDTLPPFGAVPEFITAQRHTPPVFGFGLIDAVPDDVIQEYEGKKRWKKPGVYGIANWGTELESLRGFAGISVIQPRTQPSGASRIGRFGWHGATATLWQFTTEPFNIELGVTTPFFPRENHPNGAAPLPQECRVLASGPNDTDGQMSARLYAFQAFLAAPARGPVTKAARRGEKIAKDIGCMDCHRERLRTAKDYYATWPDGSAHRVEALSNKILEPYSDFLIHDMGPLLDDHRHQGRATGRFWRTTPLWGIRFKTNFLHDGSVTTFEDAIAAHGGEGTFSRDAYFALPAAKQQLVDDWLGSL